jgi:hypothetical protein
VSRPVKEKHREPTVQRGLTMMDCGLVGSAQWLIVIVHEHDVFDRRC